MDRFPLTPSLRDYFVWMLFVLRWMNHSHLISVSVFLLTLCQLAAITVTVWNCCEYQCPSSVRRLRLTSLKACLAAGLLNYTAVTCLLYWLPINSFSNTTSLPESNLHICGVGDIKAFCAPFFYHLSPPVSLLLTAMRTISWWNNGCLTPVLTAIHVVSC